MSSCSLKTLPRSPELSSGVNAKVLGRASAYKKCDSSRRLTWILTENISLRRQRVRVSQSPLKKLREQLNDMGFKKAAIF